MKDRPSTTKNILLDISDVYTLPKGKVVIKPGDVCKHLYYIESGIIRTFYKKNKKEITSWIYFQNNYTSVWNSLLNEEKSQEYLQALAPSTIWAIPYADLQNLFEVLPSIDRWGRKLMENYVLAFNEFNIKMRFASAGEKYAFFLRYFPNAAEVKLGYVASFLGMTQETLSRLRGEYKTMQNNL